MKTKTLHKGEGFGGLLVIPQIFLILFFFFSKSQFHNFFKMCAKNTYYCPFFFFSIFFSCFCLQGLRVGGSRP